MNNEKKASAGFHILSLKGLGWWSFSWSYQRRILGCVIVAPRSVSANGTVGGITAEQNKRISNAWHATVASEGLSIDHKCTFTAGLSSETCEFDPVLAKQLMRFVSTGDPTILNGVPGGLIKGLMAALSSRSTNWLLGVCIEQSSEVN